MGRLKCEGVHISNLKYTFFTVMGIASFFILFFTLTDHKVIFAKHKAAKRLRLAIKYKDMLMKILTNNITNQPDPAFVFKRIPKDSFFRLNETKGTSSSGYPPGNMSNIALLSKPKERDLPFKKVINFSSSVMSRSEQGNNTFEKATIVNSSVVMSKFKERETETDSTQNVAGNNPRRVDGAEDPTTPNVVEQSFQRLEAIYRRTEVDCGQIFRGVTTENKKAVRVSEELEAHKPAPPPYHDLTSDCNHFRWVRGYFTSAATTEEEREFPIAFSILVSTDLEMLERLLRAIYRPHNLYCVHVDSKTDDVYYRTVQRIVSCLPSVFLTSTRVKVFWGFYSALEADILCMKELWTRGYWKYFINLTGLEFPLKTNAQMVKMLTAYKGANDVQVSVKRTLPQRWKYNPPPHDLTPLTGWSHVALSRAFVDYFLHNDTAKDLLSWSKTTLVPDETVFSTLNHNPNLRAPGAYKGHPETNARVKPYLATYQNWGNFPCASGRFLKGMCLLSSGDLFLLGSRPEMFANKFKLDKDRMVIGCLEEKLFNDTRDEYLGKRSFGMSYYRDLGFVKNQVDSSWAKGETKNELHLLHK